MVVRETKNLQNGVYSIELNTEFDSNELEFLAVYGEPTVDVGGSFTYGQGQTFSRQTQPSLVRSASPFTFSLNTLVDETAVAKVDAWSAAVIVRLGQMLATLMDNTQPSFPATVVHTLHKPDA